MCFKAIQEINTVVLQSLKRIELGLGETGAYLKALGSKSMGLAAKDLRRHFLSLQGVKKMCRHSLIISDPTFMLLHVLQRCFRCFPPYNSARVWNVPSRWIGLPELRH